MIRLGCKVNVKKMSLALYTDSNLEPQKFFYSVPKTSDEKNPGAPQANRFFVAPKI